MKHYYFLISTLLLALTSVVQASGNDLIDELFEQESQLNNSLSLGISINASNSTVYDIDLSLAINQ